MIEIIYGSLLIFNAGMTYLVFKELTSLTEKIKEIINIKDE